MPSVTLPWPEEGRNDKETLRNYGDTIIKLRKELEFLLNNLNSDNVLEAATVKADWVYAGTLTAEQINAVNGIVLGANASINWGALPTLPTAEQVGARPDTWMPTAGDVGALPWNTYIPVVPNYIQSTYIDSTNVISPFISGGVITGALFRTATSGQRLAMDSNGIISYNSGNEKSGVVIENGDWGYSELNFYQYGNKVGQLMYNSYGELSLSGMNDVVMYPGGTWDFSRATVRNISTTAKFG